MLLHARTRVDSLEYALKYLGMYRTDRPDPYLLAGASSGGVHNLSMSVSLLNRAPSRPRAAATTDLLFTKRRWDWSERIALFDKRDFNRLLFCFRFGESSRGEVNFFINLRVQKCPPGAYGVDKPISFVQSFCVWKVVCVGVFRLMARHREGSKLQCLLSLSLFLMYTGG